MGDRELFLGGLVDPAAHERTGDELRLDPDDLTTHGVIVGMTGSGKTGLAIGLLEEALLQGIPTLVLDPKGDMTNLLLGFPDLAPDDFAPWVPPDADPTDVAETWRQGLEGWGIDGSRIAALQAAADLTVYTPGSTAGTPLNVIGSLSAPDSDDAESRQDEAEGLVSGLLRLVGIDADPLSSREHILLTNLVDRAWADGRSLDLGALVQQVQDPPIRKLGVIELETFFPAKDRTDLAMRLNGLLASPAFAGWAEGEPLDIERLLGLGGDGAGAAIVYLAHLSEEERQFVVTLVLSKLVTWMRAQSGSPKLRALVYMDEVYGYVPPTAQPPAKRPILTILKQARAYGVGLVLATQNPVDLDYKAISNAGTWMIGRLQTERDKSRLLEGMSSAGGEVDISAVDATISGLDKREFLLHQSGPSGPQVFTTRWAMSYLAGPLTKDQLSQLPGASSQEAERSAAPLSEATPATVETASPPPDQLGDDETTVAPEVADGVSVRWADPAAPWLADVGASPDGTRWAAAAVVSASLLFDDTKADLRHTEEWESVVHPLGENGDISGLVEVDHDPRDLREKAPEGAVYRLPDARIDTKTFWSAMQKALKEHLYVEGTVTLFTNRALKLASRPGETEEAFVERCRVAADDAEDAEADKLRAKIDKRADRLRSQIETSRVRIAEAEEAASAKKQHELIAGAGDLLGSFLGGRRSARSLASKVKGVSSRRSQSSRAKARVEREAEKADLKLEELQELEDDLADALVELDDKWEAIAEEIEELEVGLEKNDITISDVRLVWLPVD